MFAIFQSNSYRQCQRDVLPLIKDNGIINDTIDIKKDRGDIPESCSQQEFNKILNYLEVQAIKYERNEPIIKKRIIDYNSEKLYKLKQSL